MQKSKYLMPNFYFRFALGMIGLTLFLSPIFHCIKLLQLGSTVGAYFFYISFSLTSLFFFLSFIFRKQKIKIKIDPISISLFGMLIWSGGISFYFGGEFNDVVGNLLRFLLAICCYLTAAEYTTQLNYSKLKWFASSGFYGVLIALVIIYSLGVFGPFNVYLGLSTQVLIPLFAFSLVFTDKLRFLKIAFFISLIFLGGKRGIIISVLSMTSAYYFFYAKNRLKIITLSSVFIVVFFLTSFTIFSLYDEPIDILPKAVKSRLAPFFSKDFALDRITSGRMTEIRAVFQQWEENPVKFFSGMGLGATAEYNNKFSISSVHITPISLVFSNGIFLTLIFYFSVSLLILKALLVQESSQIFKAWVLCSVGSLTTTLTLYTIFQDPLIWLSLGAISGYFYDKKKLTLYKDQSLT